MGYETIYFDLDGTLTDSGPGIMNAVAYALKALGWKVPEREVLRRYVGPPLLDSFQRYEGMNPDEARQAVEMYRVYYNVTGKFENTPYPGIGALLARLQDRGKRLIVATSKPEALSVEILEHFELARYFALIAGSTLDETRMTKAHVLRYAMARGGGENAIMVGDRCYDVEGAKENGLSCVGVAYGYGGRAELENAGAAWVVETVLELGQLLEG